MVENNDDVLLRARLPGSLVAIQVGTTCIKI